MSEMIRRMSSTSVKKVNGADSKDVAAAKALLQTLETVHSVGEHVLNTFEAAIEDFKKKQAEEKAAEVAN